MEYQHKFFKALQHTYFTKNPNKTQRRAIDIRDARLSNMVIGESWMGDHTV
jgi:hypothetical protein